MGGTGVGKSYLMYAVANEFMKTDSAFCTFLQSN